MSIARTTPAQKPRGLSRRTRLSTLASGIVPEELTAEKSIAVVTPYSIPRPVRKRAYSEPFLVQNDRISRTGRIFEFGLAVASTTGVWAVAGKRCQILYVFAELGAEFRAFACCTATSLVSTFVRICH